MSVVLMNIETPALERIVNATIASRQLVMLIEFVIPVIVLCPAGFRPPQSQ
jgi:hypothetical protein